jgi:hypothetical protein
MEGRPTSGQEPEHDNDLNDDEIVDLTNIVKPTDSDDIIDLTEVLEQPDPADASGDVSMPLMDAIPAEAAPDTPPESDEIIDLTDKAEPPEAPAVEAPAEILAGPADSQTDEEVIDLLDVATTMESEITEAEEDGPDPGIKSEADALIDLVDEASAPQAEIAESEEEAVIDLLDVATAQEDAPAGTDTEAPETISSLPTEASDEEAVALDGKDDAAPMAEAVEGVGDPEDEFSDLESRAAMLTDTPAEFDFQIPIEAAETAGPDANVELLGSEDVAPPTDETMAAEDPDKPATFVPVTPPDAADAGEPIALTEQQIQAALTSVIEKVYGEKIEQLMIQTIEKTITREIAKIKNALLYDDDDALD